MNRLGFPQLTIAQAVGSRALLPGTGKNRSSPELRMAAAPDAFCVLPRPCGLTERTVGPELQIIFVFGGLFFSPWFLVNRHERAVPPITVPSLVYIFPARRLQGVQGARSRSAGEA